MNKQIRAWGKRLRRAAGALFNKLPAPLQFALAKGTVLLGAGAVPILIIENSPRLGIWWSVLMLLYIGLLILARLLILVPREKKALLRELGPEQYYAIFPQEKKREERRRAREEKRKKKKESLQ